MTVIVALLPLLVLAGGAFLGLVPLPIPSRYRNFLPALVCVFAGLTLIVVARTTEIPVTVFQPNEALPALSFSVNWNGAALPLGLLVLVLLATRLFYRRNEDESSFIFGTLVAAAGVLLFLAADNWTTVTSAWLLVELGLLLVPVDEAGNHDAAARALGWNLAGIMAWLTAGMVVANTGGSLRLAEVPLGGDAAFFVLVAIWLRAGVYPFHVAASASVNSMGVRLGIPLLLGGYLMTRMTLQMQSAMTFSGEMQILVLAAVAATALVVVGQPHGGEAFVWMLRAAGAVLLLTPFYVNVVAAPAVSLWLTVSAILVCIFVEVAAQWRAQLDRFPLTMLVWVVVLLLVAALPLAPAFWARVGLLASAYAGVGIALWLVLVITMTFTLIPVWREILASREVAPRAPTRTDYITLAVLLLAILEVTVAAPFFLAPFGTIMQDSSTLVSEALFAPQGFAPIVFLLAGFAVPVIASFELARRWSRQLNFLSPRFTNVLDLTSVSNGLDAVYRFFRTLIQQTLALLEQPPIAWLLFLAIWFAVWVRALTG